MKLSYEWPVQIFALRVCAVKSWLMSTNLFFVVRIQFMFYSKAESMNVQASSYTTTPTGTQLQMEVGIRWTVSTISSLEIHTWDSAYEQKNWKIWTFWWIAGGCHFDRRHATYELLTELINQKPNQNSCGHNNARYIACFSSFPLESGILEYLALFLAFFEKSGLFSIILAFWHRGQKI